jgi:exopolysaccharide production protein ExoQ
VTVQGDPQAMTSTPSTRVAHAPNWFERFLFLALMSGPPKFRARDPFASLSGEIDLVVVIHIAIWACGALWVLAHLYPSAVRRGVVPSMNAAQSISVLFIAALTLSLLQSPAILLTVFSLGQLAAMLGFVWVFTNRFGTDACLRHLFIGVTVLALMTLAAVYLAPGLVTGDTFVMGETRLNGALIADSGSVAVIGLICCLSNMPPLRGPMFWGAFSLFGVLLVGSRTRSAQVAFLVFLAIGFIHGKRLRVRKLILPLGALVFSVFLLDAFASATDYLIRDRESVENMSDRIPLWQHLTSVVMREAPITGLGYYSASRVVGTDYNRSLGNAHSVFFEVLVGGGVLGAALYLVLCTSLVWFAVRLLRVASGQPSTVAAVGLLSSALLMGVTSPAALQAGPLGFAFWSLTALLPVLLREAGRARIVSDRPLYARKSSLRAGTGVRVAVINGHNPLRG